MKLIFIGSTLLEGFQYSNFKCLNQKKIIHTFIKEVKNGNYSFAYRPHPVSLKEEILIPLFIYLLKNGCELDLSPKFKIEKYNITFAITSSLLYEVIEHKKLCFAFLPGFHNLIGIPEIDLDDIKIINNKINNYDLQNLFSIERINEYAHPGNLYYSNPERIDEITNSFCNIIIQLDK